MTTPQRESAIIGWMVHLAISVLFGLGYAVSIGSRSTSWGHAVYGVVALIYGLFVRPTAFSCFPQALRRRA